MSLAARAGGRPRIFYGWYIVAAGSIAMAVMGALSYYGFSAFFKPIREETGWAAAALALPISVARIQGGILAPLVGYLVDRFGPRYLMLFGMSLMGLGFILLSRIDDWLLFTIVFIVLIQGGASFGMGNPVFTSVGNWFRRKRGRAMGFVTMGLSFGGMLVPVVAWMITQYGWRGAAMISGLIVWTVGIPLAFVIRHRPEQYGYLPDGDLPGPDDEPKGAVTSEGAQPVVAAKGGEASPVVEVDFMPGQALRTPSFWMLGLTFAARHLVTGSVALYLVPYLQHRGNTLEAAATVLALMALIGAPGRVIFGWLGDRFEKRYVLASCFIVMSVGLLLFTYTPGILGMVFFLSLYAPSYAGGLPLMPALQGEYFGRRAFGRISGLMAPVTMLGTFSGPVFAGWVFDVTGGYRLAFTILGGAGLLALVLVLSLRRPRLKEASA